MHQTGPLTLGNVVLWGFLGDPRWLEAPAGPCPDLDSDGSCDAADNCPFYLSANVAESGGDLRGNACECTDPNGDGRNTVSDLIAANIENSSPTSTSTCARQPVPGP